MTVASGDAATTSASSAILIRPPRLTSSERPTFYHEREVTPGTRRSVASPARTTLRGIKTQTALAAGVLRFGWFDMRPRALSSRQRERDVFPAVDAAADRDDDVLLAVDGVCHRRARLRRRHVDRPHFATVRL